MQDWKAFGLGALVAAISGALTYAEVLPAPYGALAGAALTLLAVFMKRPTTPAEPK